MSHRIALLALDQCHASSVIGPLDLLHAANLVAERLGHTERPLFSVEVVAPRGRPVLAANGYPLAVDTALADAAPAEVVMIPGINVLEPEALLASLARHAAVVRWLRAQYAHGALLAATCTGAFLLAETGLLAGRSAATTTWFAELFQQRYPDVQLRADAGLAEDGRLLSASSGFSYIELTLRVIEHLAGRELARACARYVVLDNRRDTPVAELIPAHVRSHDPLILKADKWMRAHLRHDIRVPDIAAHLAVSPRTLDRRFKARTGQSPSLYLQHLRLEAGKSLLAGSHYRIDQIPERIGYHDESTFRRLFKKYSGLSPRDYRRRFAAGKPARGAGR